MISGIDSLPSNLEWNYFNCVLKSGRTLNESVEGHSQNNLTTSAKAESPALQMLASGNK